MDRRVVINADDFGLCEGVNKGVAQAHTNGVLRSATIMVNMPAAEEAIEIAKKMPTLGVGVHLNLTEGKAVSKEAGVKCLLDTDGNFIYSAAKLSALSIVSGKVRGAIADELAEQIQWVIDSGIKPTHLDSHKHIHSFPVIFSIVYRLARRFEIPAIRFTFEPKELCQRPWPLPSEGGRKRASRARATAKINRFQRSDFLKTDAFFGIAHTGKMDVSFFKAFALYSSAQTAEIMTHPGFIKGLDPSKTRLIQQRQIELEALCSENTKQNLNDARIKLVHYGEL